MEEPISLIDLLNKVILAINKNCKKLMKLKISNMNLRNENFISNLCTVFCRNNLIYLDVSWAKLKSKELNSIVYNLKKYGNDMRNLNLSYNDLDFTQGSTYLQYSLSFMENIGKFLQRAKYINHINLSGMNYGPLQILELIKMLNKC